MDYITAKDAADKWDISVRRVQILLKNGRIEGAVRHGKEYLIPKDAAKPDDGRKYNYRRPLKEAQLEPDRAIVQASDAISAMGKKGALFQIALCEDEKIFAETQEQFCRETLDAMNIEYGISVFENAQGFLGAFLDEGKRYDLILLDIVMDGMNGVELARKIRESDSGAAIIFLTSSPDYMAAGYEVGAFRYLQKENYRQTLGDLLKKVYEDKYQALCLILQSGATTRRIEIKSIIALEAAARKVDIHTADGGLFHYNGSLTGLLDTLPKGHFIRCHEAFAVNINNMRELNNREFLAQNGKRIPVSRSHMNNAKSAFLNKFLEN
ncbi:MAG: response regulator [Clostridiales bacterium]|jgi:DNA-binding LytR/AlgR family response regulator|nr:response regulator [Clostridiales bacterium]